MNNIFQRNVKETTELLACKTVGIAGCGGLGSNIAVALTRAGIGKLVLLDFDIVEESNLNRQYFFQSDIGKLKTEALAEHLININPNIAIVIINKKMTKKDINLFHDCEILMEAFDKAENKKFLIEAWSVNFPDRPIICGSGISGIGNIEALKIQNAGNIYVCGDQNTDMTEGLNSARIAVAANMQASVALSLLTKNPI